MKRALDHVMDGDAEPLSRTASKPCPPWTLARLVGFRLLFCYLVLINAPFPLGVLPWTEGIADLWSDLFVPPTVWMAEHILGLGDIVVEPNGSGDRTLDYLLVLDVLILAVLATIAWSLLQRRARDHERLLAGLRLYVRYCVAASMLSYGFVKIFVGQFPPPTGAQLARSYGESTPMNLLWTLMGASRPYAMVAGFMEALGGALLLGRRVAGLGALLLLVVMGNVVLLNFCYDVPVKLYSLHIWGMCLFIAWPFLPQVARAVVANRVNARAPERRIITSARRRRVALALHVLFGVWLIGSNAHASWKRQAALQGQSPQARAIQSAFDVDEMTVDGRLVPMAEKSPLRWRTVSFRTRSMRVQFMDRRVEVYQLADETTIPMTMSLRRFGEPEGTTRGTLQLRADATGHVVEGSFEGRPIRAHLLLIDTSNSPLMTRGFHWINEVPFNR